MSQRSITISVEDALTQKDAAYQLGITTMTLWRWIKAGKISTVRLGRYSFIPKDEIARLRNKESPQ